MNVSHNTNKCLTLGAIALVIVVLGGCTHYSDYSAFVRQPAPLVTATEYRMAPPDFVLVQSKVVKEINNHQEQIAPDGKLNLPLLGPVFVAGRTTTEVAEELQERSKDYYTDADVSVRVIGYNSKKVYVFGEVNGQGAYAYNGANTVLSMLAQAVPSRLADPTRIHVLRPNHDGTLIKRMTIDMDEMVKHGDLQHDAVLEEGDILYVPANGFAAVGLTLQTLLLPIQPAVSTVRAPVDIYSAGTSAPYGGASSSGINGGR